MAEVQYNVWLDRGHFEDAESVYQEHLARLRCGSSETASSCQAGPCQTSATAKSSLACEIARAREHIQKSLGSDGGSECKLMAKIDSLEKETREFKKIAQDLKGLVTQLTSRVAALEKGLPAVCPTKQVCPSTPTAAKTEPAKKETEEEEEDFELFDDEEDEEEKERIKQERVKAYEARKANKPVLIAKSNIILDVKPWDDETDMAKLEECVRSVEMDGLLWGNSKFVPLAYGIRKLQISCVVEDDKVSTDDLEEKICAFEDYIQSMDIAAFNKI